MDFGDVVAEEIDEWRDAPELPRLGLDGVVHVAQVLEVRGGIGLDHTVGVVQELDDLVEVGVAPLYACHACKEEKRGRAKIRTGPFSRFQSHVFSFRDRKHFLTQGLDKTIGTKA